jgi:hypothetical protein
MNSPLVIEQAKRLIALPEFLACKEDSARVQFLYERIYQRLPKPEELGLGADFVAQTLPPKAISAGDDSARPGANGGKRLGPKQLARQRLARKGAGDAGSNAPLTPWEEYAHALLQANEMCFIN